MPSDSSAFAAMAPPRVDDAVRPRTGDTQSMSAVRDEELAVIFREMRRASERSLESLAEQLRTPPSTLVALESGEIDALPEWGEASRVVGEYTALLHLDGRPVLRRLEKQFTTRQPGPSAQATAATPARPAPAPAGASAAKPAAAPPSPLPPKAVKGPPLPPGARIKTAMPAPAATQKPEAAKAQDLKPEPEAPGTKAREPAADSVSKPPVVSDKPAAKPQPEQPADITASLTDPPQEQGTTGKARRSRKGMIVTWVLLLAVFGAMALGVRHAIQHPAAVWSTVDLLPEPVPQAVRSVWELVRPLEDAPQPAPAANPQSQKSDRLPGTGAPQGN